MNALDDPVEPIREIEGTVREEVGDIRQCAGEGAALENANARLVRLREQLEDIWARGMGGRGRQKHGRGKCRRQSSVYALAWASGCGCACIPDGGPIPWPAATEGMGFGGSMLTARTGVCDLEPQGTPQ